MEIVTKKDSKLQRFFIRLLSKLAFKKMVEILTEADQKKKARGGRKSKISIENRLLMALEYMREYRNRRKRFSLRFNLIAGIHNLELRQ